VRELIVVQQNRLEMFLFFSFIVWHKMCVFFCFFSLSVCQHGTYQIRKECVLSFQTFIINIIIAFFLSPFIELSLSDKKKICCVDGL